MKRLFAIILLCAAFAGLTWVVWFRPLPAEEEEKKPEAEVPVRVAKVTRGILRSFVTAYGTVEPEPSASVRVAVGVAGVVTAVNCVEGQRVERGTVLFELDGRTAEVAAGFAEKTLERQKKLLQVEGTSQKLVQDAEQQLASVRAQLALLQVRSPIAGTVTRVNIKPGEAADLTTVLAEVIDFDRLSVTLGVAGAELTSLKAGQPVEVLPADSTNAIDTSLVFVGPYLDAKTGSGVARARLAPNSGLKPGQFVRARVQTGEHRDCLIVPAASVAKDPSGASFIALVEEEKAVLKPVKVGVREGDAVEVEGEGLEAGKTVVTEGAYGLIVTQQFATKIRVTGE